MKIEVVAFVMVLIDFCLSVACVAMGALHLNECQNQAATFLLVNGGDHPDRDRPDHSLPD